MPTARDHMLADMTHLFAQEGEGAVDVVIDGYVHRAVVQELDIVPGLVDEGTIRRRSIWLEKGALTLPKPGYVIEVDGDRWTVESVDPTGILDAITMAMAV